MPTVINESETFSDFDLMVSRRYFLLINNIDEAYPDLFTISQLVQFCAINAAARNVGENDDVESFNQKYQQAAKLLFAKFPHVAVIDFKPLSDQQYSTFINDSEYAKELEGLENYFLNTKFPQLTIEKTNDANYSRLFSDHEKLEGTAKEELQKIIDALNSARELAIKSANGDNSATERQDLQAKVIDHVKIIKNIIRYIEISARMAYTLDQHGIIKNTLNASTDKLGSHSLTIDLDSNALQVNHSLYYESTGENVRVVQGYYNVTAPSSTITLTSLKSSDQKEPITIIPKEHATASETAAAINQTSFAKATAITQVKFSGFELNGDGSFSLEIRKDLDCIFNGPLFDKDFFSGESADIYSKIATSFNQNTSMQRSGCYAIAHIDGVTIISPSGYDVCAKSYGNLIIESVQLLDTSGSALGDSVRLGSDSSLCAPGVLCLEVNPDASVSFGDNKMFAQTLPVRVGVSSAQNTNLNVAQKIRISNELVHMLVDIADHQSASSVVKSINGEKNKIGVSAFASTSAVIQNVTADGTISFNLIGENIGAPICVSAYVTNTDLTQLLQAINNVCGTTGIVAQFNGSNSSILLTLHSGDDIKISNFCHLVSTFAQSISTTQFICGDGSGCIKGIPSSDAPILSFPSSRSMDVIGSSDNNVVTLYSGGIRNLDSTVISGKVTFTSISEFQVSSKIDGFEPRTYNSTFNPLLSIDVSTADGAVTAITIIDYALDQVTHMHAVVSGSFVKFQDALSKSSNFREFLSKHVIDIRESSLVNKDTQRAQEVLFSSALRAPQLSQQLDCAGDDQGLELAGDLASVSSLPRNNGR